MNKLIGGDRTQIIVQQVLQSPDFVLRELVDNSIDAGSTQIGNSTTILF